MAFKLSTNAELEQHQKQEQQAYVDRVVLPKVQEQQKTIVQSLSDFGAGKTQDYETVSKLPSELQSYRLGLRALSANGYDVGDVDSISSALQDAETGVKDWLSGFKDEQDYNDRYYYLSKYKDASLKDLDNSVRGLNQQLGMMQPQSKAKQTTSAPDISAMGASATGDTRQRANTTAAEPDPKRAALQQEINWIKNNRQYFYTDAELDSTLTKLDAQLADARKKMGDVAGSTDAVKGSRMRERAKSIKSQIATLSREKDDRATTRMYESFDDKTKEQFDNYVTWNKLVQSEQLKGKKWSANTYVWEKGMNGLPDRYRIDGTKTYVTDEDELEYAKAQTGIKDFHQTLRKMGYSSDEIKSVLDRAKKQHNAKTAQAKQKKAASFAENHEFLASLASVPLELMSGVGYLDQLGQYVTGGTDALTGRRRYVDPNTGASQLGMTASTYRDVVAGELSELGAAGKAGSFLYQTGMSILDFMAADGVGKLVSTGLKAVSVANDANKASKGAMALLGGAAASQTVQDARARGASDDQAMALGALAGVFETLFEEVSLDKLQVFRSSAASSAHYTAEMAVKDVLKQSGVEASEELATTLANSAADAIIMADKSQINQAILGYVQSGMDRESATRKAWQDWAVQLGLDGLGGALSGGLLSGGHVAAMGVSDSVVGTAIMQESATSQAGLMPLVSRALELTDHNSPAYQLAQSLSEQMSDSSNVDASTPASQVWGNIKASDVGRLAKLYQTASREQVLNPSVAAQLPRTHQTVQQTDGGKTQVATVLSTTAESLVQQGVTATEAARYAPTVESILAGEHVSNSKLDAVMRVPAVATVVQGRTGVEINVKDTSSNLRKAYRAAAEVQRQRIEDVDAQAAEMQNQQDDMAAQQLDFEEQMQTELRGIEQSRSEAERMLLDSDTGTAQATAAAPEEKVASQVTRSDDDVVQLQTQSGVNNMTRAEFKLSARQAQPDAAISDSALDAQFDTLLAQQQSLGRPITPEEFRAQMTATEAAPAQAAPEEGGDTTAQKPTEAGEPEQTPAEAAPPAPKEDAPDGVTFRAKEGGVQELNNEQKWVGALAYRLLRPLGIKRIIWDEAHCGENGRASISASDGTIYLNPAKLDARSAILKAIGHEITHPATDDPNGKANPFAEKIISAIQEVGKNKMLRAAAAGSIEADMQSVREQLLSLADEAEREGRTQDAETIREDANTIIPDNLLWQASNLGAVREAMIKRYKRFYLKRADAYEAAGDVEAAERYRQDAENFDEHAANQEIASDWVGMLFENPALMEKLAGVEPSILSRILRSLSKLRYKTTSSVLNGNDRKQADKMLEALMSDVNTALKKNSQLAAFRPKQKTEQKRRTKRQTVLEETRTKSRMDRAAEAQRRVAEQARAQREAAGETAKPTERHMFVGEKSKLADLESLKVANDFEQQGLSADQIRITTGWFRGADGKWRSEISDDTMTLRTQGSARIYNDYPEYREFSALEYRLSNNETLSEAERARYDELAKTYIPLRKQMNKEARKRIREGKATLDDVLVHPELFEAYPELRNIKIKIADLGNPRLYGSFNSVDNLLSINSKAAGMTNKEMRSTIAHEVQHAVQGLEGFARGANEGIWGLQRQWKKDDWKPMRNSLSPDLQREFDQWRSAYNQSNTQAMADIEERVTDADFRRVIGAYQLAHDPRTNFQLYQDTAGEREARDTQARLTDTPEQRRRKRPDLGENPVFLEDPYKRNPTKPPKTKERFSADEPVEYTKDLVAVHAVTARGLMRYLREGAIPSASIAIRHDYMEDPDDYGEVTIFFRRPSIDPEVDPRNKVWGGDAWTPMRSHLTYEHGIDKSAAKAFAKTISDHANISSTEANKVLNIINQSGADEAAHYFGDFIAEGSTRLEDQKIREIGRKIFDSYRSALAREASSIPGLRTTAVETLRAYNPGNPVGDFFISEAAEEFDDALSTNFSEQIEAGEYDELRAFLEEVRGNDVDVYKTLKSAFDNLVTGERQIVTGTGEVLPYSPENIVKAMYESGVHRGVATEADDIDDPDLNGWQAAAIPEFGSVDEIHAYDYRLRDNQREHHNALDDLWNKLRDFAQSAARLTRVSEYKIAEMLAQNAQATTPEEIKRAFFRNGVILTDSLAEKALEANRAFDALPQRYFEAKTERVMDISEILAVGVPDNVGTEVMQALKDAGIHTLTYKAGDTKSRAEMSNDPTIAAEKFSVDPDYADALNRWDRAGRPRGDVFTLGTTGEVLQKLGIRGGTIKLLGDKVQTVLTSALRGHPEMTIKDFEEIPEALENPVLVLASNNRTPGGSQRINENTRVVVFGDKLARNGLPVMAVLDFNPNAGDTQMVNSAYTKQPYSDDDRALLNRMGAPWTVDELENAVWAWGDTERVFNFIKDSAVLYADKERAASMLSAAGFLSQAPNGGPGLPTALVQSGYTGNITYQNGDVKISGVPFDQVFRKQSGERWAVDPDAYKAFFSDLYERHGLTAQAAAASTRARPERQVSQFRLNTLQHTDDMFERAELTMEGLRKEDMTYDVLSNIESMRRAKERLEQDYDGTVQDLNSRDWRQAEDLDAGMGILAAKIAEARDTKNYQDAIDWAHIIRAQGTAAGQFVQAFAKYSQTPEGVLLNAVDALEQSDLSETERDNLLTKIADFSNTLHAIQRGDEQYRDDLIDLILRQAQQRNTKVGKQTLKDLGMQKIEYLYDAALNQMDQIAKDYIKPSGARGLATFQTISHLFNLKTASRNLVSNTAFNPLAAIGNNLGFLPDVIASAFTGRRGVGIDKWVFSKQMWTAMSEGARTAHVELALDIDPRPNQRDKYGTARRTWKMVSNNPITRMGSTLEKAMGFELNWTDEFHKGAIKGQILNGLEPLVKSGQITQELAEEWAEQEALYRAFQDDTFANGLLSIIKNGLNTIGFGRTGQNIGRLEVKEFGLGDLVQKYTQVPGALFTRAVEFSPVGYIKTISLLVQMSSTNRAAAKAYAAIDEAQARADRNPDNKALLSQVFRAKEDAARKENEAITAQRNFALAMGRATTGSGLIGAFAMAAAAGILKRADDEDDPDAKALMTSMGVTGTQFNVSAAMRWIDGQGTKWQEGDKLVAVEFLEPMNATMTIGALIAKEAKEDSTTWEKMQNTGTQNIIGLWDALQELPTMQTLNTIQQTRQYYDPETAAIGIEPLDIAIEVARGSVTGFIPSPIRQAAQIGDTVQRDTYTSKNVWAQTADSLKNSVPGLRNKLPAKLDNFGQPRQLEDRTLNAMNAAFLPGAIRTYRLSPEAEELDRVYKATGEAGIYPDRNAPYSKSVKIDGEDVKLTLSKEEREKFQQTRGQNTFDLYSKMMDDSFYTTCSPSEQAELLAETKAYANYLAVKELAKGQGKDYSNDKYEKYSGALEHGYTMASWLTTSATASAAEGEDLDGDGKTDDGTKKKAALNVIQSLGLTDEQKAFWFHGSSYNGDDKDKIENAMGQGISASTYIDAQLKLADAHGTDTNGDGKTDSGSLQADKIRIIQSLPLTAAQKKWLFLLENPTSTKKADSTAWTDTSN